MTYRLDFRTTAENAWRKLGATVRSQFEKKLQERLEHPRVPKDALRNFPGHYKIKLRDAGYRLVYHVDGETVTVLVVSIGKRERGEVYLDIPGD